MKYFRTILVYQSMCLYGSEYVTFLIITFNSVRVVFMVKVDMNID